MSAQSLFITQLSSGWGENREDGKEGEENRVKNGIFFYLVQERKQEGKKIVWKIFPPSPQNFVQN